MGAKHSWDAAHGVQDRWGPCPTRTTCSAAIFASMATSPDAMKGSVSASGPIRAMSFCRAEIPIGVCDCCGAKHWNQDAEAIIEEVVRREYDNLRKNWAYVELGMNSWTN